MTQKGIGALMTDMSEREKKTLFAGSVPIGLNRNQVGAWRARARGGVLYVVGMRLTSLRPLLVVLFWLLL